ARRGKLMAVDLDGVARLSASPRQIGRGAGRDAAVGDQCRLLSAPDGGHQAGDLTADICGILRAHTARMGAGRYPAALTDQCLPMISAPGRASCTSSA